MIDLGAPSFTLWATSTTLTVHVHQKPILKKLFPYGISYTIYLKEKAENKVKHTLTNTETAAAS